MDSYDPAFLDINEDSENYFNNQKDIILSDKNIVDKNKIKHKKNRLEWYKPLDEREDRYDPLLNHLSITGGEKKDSFITQDRIYLDVNSNYRVKTPKLVVDKEILLDDDPITFTDNSSDIMFKCPDHNFSIGDRITVTGVNTKPIKLRTKIGISETIQFTEDSEYLTINYDHDIPKRYNDSFITVTINGIRGENIDTLIRDTDINDSVGNIDVNFINRTHTVIIVKPEEKNVPDIKYSRLKFYIKLPRAFKGDYNLSFYNFTIKFNSIKCIPINFINAGYPITVDNNIGFHIVKNSTKNTITVGVKQSAMIDTELFFSDSEEDIDEPIIMSGGGKYVVLNKILKIIDGYPFPNFYSVPFPKVLNNVTSIKLISSEFPNSIKSFNESNNKLYWQNVENGGTVFSIAITPGNYDVPKLISEIETKSGEISRGLPVESSYDDNHIISTSINEITSRVEFLNFKKAVLSGSIIATTPQIQVNPALDSFSDETKFLLLINHKNHGLRIGDTIQISKAIEHLGIQPNNINGTHTIISVNSDDSYTIKLPKINISPIRNNTRGGNTMEVLVSSLFRMRFDYNDTCGNLLGFRDVGKPYAITPYKTKITNYERYDIDILTDENGNDINIKNNGIKLSSFDYILMSIQNVSNMITLGPEKEIFAKILLNGDFGKTVYNSFVNAHKIYPDPLTKLEELVFRFYLPNGELVDFDQIDHSFTLEIKYILETPKGTNIPNTTSRYIEQKDIVDLGI